MKLTKLIQTTLIFLPLLLVKSHAQEATTETQEDILKKGNSWHYDVTLTVPSGTEFQPEFPSKGETTPRGTVYKFTELQQSLGESLVEEIGEKIPKVNIHIDGKYRKQQLLKLSDGILLYFGTYTIDPKNPDKKAGFVTKAPIPIYSDKAQVAEKWEWKHEKILHFQFRVISKNTSVTVKAGKFNADKIRMEQIDSNSGKVLTSKEIWFAKGVGVVKEVEKQYIPNGKAIHKILELTKFANEPIK